MPMIPVEALGKTAAPVVRAAPSLPERIAKRVTQSSPCYAVSLVGDAVDGDVPYYGELFLSTPPVVGDYLTITKIDDPTWRGRVGVYVVRRRYLSMLNDDALTTVVTAVVTPE